MPALPTRFASIIVAFSPLFRQQTWRHFERLLLGAILAPGIRTVARVLRVTGLEDERHFVNYHRVLSRAVWSSRAASRILVGVLVRAFVPTGPVVVGIDDTIERRCGAKIRAKVIYRDPVRSSDSHFVKASGIRWPLNLDVLAHYRRLGGLNVHAVAGANCARTRGVVSFTWEDSRGVRACANGCTIGSAPSVVLETELGEDRVCPRRR